MAKFFRDGNEILRVKKERALVLNKDGEYLDDELRSMEDEFAKYFGKHWLPLIQEYYPRILTVNLPIPHPDEDTINNVLPVNKL